jgi:RNA polymerase-binding transcription factor DksA
MNADMAALISERTSMHEDNDTASTARTHCQRRRKGTVMADLTDDQLRQIVDLLSRREAELQADVHDAKDAGVASPEPRPREVHDPVDNADERFLEGLDHVQLLRDQEELRDIEGARERIRQRRFGLCEACDQPIPYARLLVQPTARFCLQHQAEWESSHPSVPPFAA